MPRSRCICMSSAMISLYTYIKCHYLAVYVYEVPRSEFPPAPSCSPTRVSLSDWSRCIRIPSAMIVYEVPCRISSAMIAVTFAPSCSPAHVNRLKASYCKWLKPRPQYGLDGLIYDDFARKSWCLKTSAWRSLTSCRQVGKYVSRQAGR